MNKIFHSFSYFDVLHKLQKKNGIVIDYVTTFIVIAIICVKQYVFFWAIKSCKASLLR